MFCKQPKNLLSASIFIELYEITVHALQLLTSRDHLVCRGLCAKPQLRTKTFLRSADTGSAGVENRHPIEVRKRTYPLLQPLIGDLSELLQVSLELLTRFRERRWHSLALEEMVLKLPVSEG